VRTILRGEPDDITGRTYNDPEWAIRDLDGDQIESVVFAIIDITERRRRQTAIKAIHNIATTIQSQGNQSRLLRQCVRQQPMHPLQTHYL